MTKLLSRFTFNILSFTRCFILFMIVHSMLMLLILLLLLSTHRHLILLFIVIWCLIDKICIVLWRSLLILKLFHIINAFITNRRFTASSLWTHYSSILILINTQTVRTSNSLYHTNLMLMLAIILILNLNWSLIRRKHWILSLRIQNAIILLLSIHSCATWYHLRIIRHKLMMTVTINIWLFSALWNALPTAIVYW
jgi:hypothetical protein